MIFFRVDANSKIGMGHVMRCLSVAEAARDRGMECRFISADASARRKIEAQGFPFQSLGTDYTRMESELEELIPLLRNTRPELLIMDSYFMTVEYVSRLKPLVRLACFDEFVRTAYPVDIMINYNIYAVKRDYRELYATSPHVLPRLLLGPKFVPLRKEFCGLPPRPPAERLGNVLFLSGGADPAHATLQFLDALPAFPLEHVVFHVVLGGMSKDWTLALEKASGQKNVRLYRNVSDIWSLMSKCDAAVSAAGSTLYELCACGVPTVCYVLADNQSRIASAFHEQGLIPCVGDVRKNPGTFQTALATLTEWEYAPKIRADRSECMRKVTDGNGAENIIEDLALSFTERSR